MKIEHDRKLFEFTNNMLQAADMIANVEDRKLVYAVIDAAEKSMMHQVNPRRMFYMQRHKFPHINLDMEFKNWDE